MEVNNELVYCHNRKCVRDDCIRKEIYMPYNVLCRRRTFKCSAENGYKDFLGEDSDIGTESSYIDIIRELVSDKDIKFYIEPFVGNSKVFYSISGDFIKYGTDIDGKKIDKMLKDNPDMKKNLKAGDYKTWSKVLLDDKYNNHCIVYCEPPLEMLLDDKGFINILNAWAEHNTVIVRSPNEDVLITNKWKELSKVDNRTSIYKVT